MTQILRVGVIGASPSGSWGSAAHLPALTALPQFEVTAVSTAHVETARKTAERFGVRHAFGDARQLVTSPDVDVVTVAVRVPAHKELVSLALDAGKHVYCEWPLGRTTAEAESLHAAAKASGIVHMIGLQARQAPAITHARDLILNGEIGTVCAAQLIHSVPWMFGGRASSAYLLDRDSGAHYLSIPGGHSIDALHYLLGGFESVSATLARVGNISEGAGFARPSHDQAVITGSLKSGAVANLRLQGSSQNGTGIRLEISGTKGDLVISAMPGVRGIQMGALKLQRTTALGVLEDVVLPEDRAVVGGFGETGPAANVGRAYLAMHAAIIADAPASPDFGDAVALQGVLDAVEISDHEGRRVAVAV